MISIDTVSYTPNIKIKLGLQHHAQLLTQQSSKQLQDLASQHQHHRTCLENFSSILIGPGIKTGF